MISHTLHDKDWDFASRLWNGYSIAKLNCTHDELTTIIDGLLQKSTENDNSSFGNTRIIVESDPCRFESDTNKKSRDQDEATSSAYFNKLRELKNSNLSSKYHALNAFRHIFLKNVLMIKRQPLLTFCKCSQISVCLLFICFWILSQDPTIIWCRIPTIKPEEFIVPLYYKKAHVNNSLINELAYRLRLERTESNILDSSMFNSSNLVNKLFNEFRHHITEYHTYPLIVEQVDEYEYIILYGPSYAYLVPVTLRLISNAILSKYSNNFTLVSNSNKYLQKDKSLMDFVTHRFQFGIRFGLFMSFAAIVAFISFSTSRVFEKYTRAQTMQIQAGVSLKIYWLSTFLVDLLLIIFTVLAIHVILRGFAIYYYPDVEPYFHSRLIIAKVIICHCLIGAAQLSQVYFMGLIFSKPITSLVFITGILTITGPVFAILVELQHLQSAVFKNWVIVLDYLFLSLPNYCIHQLYDNIYSNYYARKICTDERIKRVCEMLTDVKIPCCEEKSEYNYVDYTKSLFSFKRPGVGRLFIASLLNCVLYWSLIVIFELKLFTRFKYLIRKSTLNIIRTFRHKTLIEPIYEATYGEIIMKDASVKRNNGYRFFKASTKFAKSSITCIIGSNGSGKSSVMDAMTGIIYPDEGEICVNTMNTIMYNQRNIMKDVVCCYQSNSLFYFLTVSNQLISHLSGGTCRRVNVAIVMLCNKDIMIFDEPNAGVDSVSARKINDMIFTLHQLNRTVIYSSHRLGESFNIFGNYILMSEGKMTHFIDMNLNDPSLFCYVLCVYLNPKCNAGSIVLLYDSLKMVDQLSVAYQDAMKLEFTFKKSDSFQSICCLVKNLNNLIKSEIVTKYSLKYINFDKKQYDKIRHYLLI
ncbi:hypothetical protein GJ496_010119 [Pomphorhynchus laevis]|nr:hypothetical protein GJ496_010119 [Pomphorhynchus laevis]